MQLVDKEDDVPVVPDLVEHGADALFKLAAVLRPRHHARKVERENALVHQLLRHTALGNALGKALDDRCFANARLADEHGVVFRPAREDADGPFDLLLAPNDGVEPSLARHGRQVARELHERLAAAALAPARTHLARAAAARRQAHGAHGLGVEPARVHALAVQQAHGGVAPVAQQAQQQVSRFDLAAAGLDRLRHRHFNGTARVRRQPLRRGKIALSPAERARDERAEPLLLNARRAQRAPRHIVLLARHRQQQMLAAHIPVSQLERRRLRAAQQMLAACAEPSFLQGFSPPVRFSPPSSFPVSS